MLLLIATLKPVWLELSSWSDFVLYNPALQHGWKIGDSKPTVWTDPFLSQECNAPLLSFHIGNHYIYMQITLQIKKKLSTSKRPLVLSLLSERVQFDMAYDFHKRGGGGMLFKFEIP